MKALLFSGVLAVVLGSCQNTNKSVRDAAVQSLEEPAAPQPGQPQDMVTPVQTPVPAGPVTTIAFTEDNFNFGTVAAGEKVKHVFKFKNTGSEPLILSDVRTTCGCTVPTWPREPIAPGKSGEIVVQFDSTGKSGAQSRRVTIVANTNPPETFVNIEGEVTPALKNYTTSKELFQ